MSKRSTGAHWVDLGVLALLCALALPLACAGRVEELHRGSAGAGSLMSDGHGPGYYADGAYSPPYGDGVAVSYGDGVGAPYGDGGHGYDPYLAGYYDDHAIDGDGTFGDGLGVDGASFEDGLPNADGAPAP